MAYAKTMEGGSFVLADRQKARNWPEVQVGNPSVFSIRVRDTQETMGKLPTKY
jgi:hypothetical protein